MVTQFEIGNAGQNFEVLGHYTPQIRRDLSVLRRLNPGAGALGAECNYFHTRGHYDVMALGWVRFQSHDGGDDRREFAVQDYQRIWNREVAAINQVQVRLLFRFGCIAWLLTCKTFHYLFGIDVPVFGGQMGPMGWGVLLGLMGRHYDRESHQQLLKSAGLFDHPEDLAPLLGAAALVHLLIAGHRIAGALGLATSFGLAHVAYAGLDYEPSLDLRSTRKARVDISDLAFAQVWRDMHQNLAERYERFASPQTAAADAADLADGLLRDVNVVLQHRSLIEESYGVLSGRQSRAEFDALVTYCRQRKIAVDTFVRLQRGERGATFDSLLQHYISLDQRTTCGVAWRHQRLCDAYKQCQDADNQVPAVRRVVPLTAEMLVARHQHQLELNRRYNRIRAAAAQLVEATKVWIQEERGDVQLRIRALDRSFQDRIRHLAQLDGTFDPMGWFKLYDELVADINEALMPRLFREMARVAEGQGYSRQVVAQLRMKSNQNSHYYKHALPSLLGGRSGARKRDALQRASHTDQFHGLLLQKFPPDPKCNRAQLRGTWALARYLVELCGEDTYITRQIKAWDVQEKLDDFESGALPAQQFCVWLAQQIDDEYEPSIDPIAPDCPAVALRTMDWIVLNADALGGARRARRARA